jgi:hypothetical protein
VCNNSVSTELKIHGVYANSSTHKDEHNIMNHFIIWNKEFTFGNSIQNLELVTQSAIGPHRDVRLYVLEPSFLLTMDEITSMPRGPKAIGAV